MNDDRVDCQDCAHFGWVKRRVKRPPPFEWMDPRECYQTAVVDIEHCARGHVAIPDKPRRCPDHMRRRAG